MSGMDEAQAKATGSRERSNANLRPFVKGQSGNPSGRAKKVKAVVEEAEKNAEKALKRLARMIDSDDEKVALAACQAILDRAIGKPKQSMEVKSDVTHHGSESVSDTAQWIADTLRARADRQAEEPLSH